MPIPVLDSNKAASSSQAVAGVVQRTSAKATGDDWDDWLDTDEHADSDSDDG